MKTTWQFRDFVVGTGVWAGDNQKAVNVALYAVGYPTMLWINERRPVAPFGKLNVHFVDRDRPSRTPGRAWADPLGIGVVTIGVAQDELFANAAHPAWVLPQVELAMRLVEEQLGFKSDELNAFIRSLRENPLPFVHLFERYARTHRKSGRTFTPWMSFAPNHTEIGVRVVPASGVKRDIVLMARDGQIWFWDDFPMSKTTFRDGSFLILDKNGAALASIPIEDM